MIPRWMQYKRFRGWHGGVERRGREGSVPALDLLEGSIPAPFISANILRFVEDRIVKFWQFDQNALFSIP